MERPAGVTLIAVVAIVGGLVQVGYAGLPLLVGLWALGAGPVGAEVGVAAILIASVLMVGAGAQIVFGIGALRMAGWAWTVGVLVSGFNAVANVVAMLSNNGVGNYAGLFLSGAVLFYLTTPSVKARFGK